MNARMLSQLIASYQQSTGLGPEELSFIQSSAAELGVPQAAVDALVELYRKGSRGVPASDPDLVARFGQALAANQALSADDRALLAELGVTPMSVSAPVVNNVAREAEPAAVEPSRVRPEPKHELSAPAAQLFDAIEAEYLTHPLADTIRLALLQRAAQLGVPAALANALVLLQQSRLSKSADAYPPDALDQLIAVMVSLGPVSEADHALLARLAERLQLNPNALAAMLRLARALHGRSAAEAKLILTNLTQALGDENGKLPVAGSAYLMRKLTEVSALAPLPELKTEPTKAAPTVATAPLKVGLNETQVFELDSADTSAKEAVLQIHPMGFNWFFLTNPKAGEPQVVINGRSFAASEVEEITFSRIGDGIAFRHIQGGKHHIIVRGQTVASFDLAGALTFSNDGTRFCAIGRQSKAWHVWDDGKLSEPRAAYREPAYNPATNALAYFGFENQRWRLYLDHRPQEPALALAGSLTVAPDGGAVVYWARVGSATHAVVNGKVGPPFEGVGEFVFGTSHEHLGYLANHKGKLAAVVQHTPGPGFERIRRLSFSPDKRSFSYIGTSDELEHIVVNHQITAMYDRVQALLWSAEGTSYGAVVQKGRRKRVTIDGSEQKQYDEVSRLAFSSTGRSHAYQALNKEGWVIVQDGLESEAFMDLDELTYSPDGRRLAYFSRIKGQGVALTVNSERGVESQMAKQLVWSADSKATAHLLFDKGGWHLCVNGHVANKQPYTEVLSPLRYDELRDCFYLLVRQGKQILVVAYH